MGISAALAPSVQRLLGGKTARNSQAKRACGNGGARPAAKRWRWASKMSSILPFQASAAAAKPLNGGSSLASIRCKPSSR